MVEDYAVAGVTSNPTIFNKAISGSSDYDEALRSLVESGERDPRTLFLRLAIEDIGMVADVLRPVYESRTGATASPPSRSRRAWRMIPPERSPRRRSCSRGSPGRT